MTPQEIIREIHRLPPEQQREVRESLDRSEVKPQLTEREVLEILYAKGVIGNIPDLDAFTDEDDDFEPIEVEGEPISEMIIRERR